MASNNQTGEDSTIGGDGNSGNNDAQPNPGKNKTTDGSIPKKLNKAFSDKPKNEKGNCTPAQAYETLHRCEEDREVGACLSGHHPSHSQKRSCSYRAQAVYRAFGSGDQTKRNHIKDVYFFNDDNYECIPEKLKIKPGKKKNASIPFMDGAWPWPNAAHHLIPKATLIDLIIEKSSDDEGLVSRAISGLLKSKYNINHHANMMILPQEDKKAESLGLPAHPIGKRGIDSSHREYSSKIKDHLTERLGKILDPLADWAKLDNNNPKCTEPTKEAIDFANNLKQLSNDIHDAIIEAQKAYKSKSELGPKKEDLAINSDYFSNILDKFKKTVEGQA